MQSGILIQIKGRKNMKHEKISKSSIGCMFVATLVQVLIVTSILFVVYSIF